MQLAKSKSDRRIVSSSESNLNSPDNQQTKRDARLLPKRTTKQSQKLALFPGVEEGVDGAGVEPPVTLPHTTAVPDASLLSRQGRSFLPRVTAYCTAGIYNLEKLDEYLNARKESYSEPRRYDEALYSTYTPILVQQDAPLIEIDQVDPFFEKSVDCYNRPLSSSTPYNHLAKTICHFGECFFFDYGGILTFTRSGSDVGTDGTGGKDCTEKLEGV